VQIELHAQDDDGADADAECTLFEIVAVARVEFAVGGEPDVFEALVLARYKKQAVQRQWRPYIKMQFAGAAHTPCALTGSAPSSSRTSRDTCATQHFGSTHDASFEEKINWWLINNTFHETKKNECAKSIANIVY
jgi:hypothetical protein